MSEQRPRQLGILASSKKKNASFERYVKIINNLSKLMQKISFSVLQSCQPYQGRCVKFPPKGHIRGAGERGWC